MKEGWETLAGASKLAEYGRASLHWFDGRYGDAISKILASPLRERSKVPPFDAAPFKRLFDFGRDTHCFDADGHQWARFHEPQITSGLCHYLDHGGFDARVDRALAIYRAAVHCAGGGYRLIDASEIAELEIIPEADANTAGEKRGRKRVERGRIDILVAFELEDGTRTGVAIEAKFDHHLTPGQLKKYTRHLEAKRNWIADQAPLLVVSRAPIELSGETCWKSVSWWRFLEALEREIGPVDDPEFRKFRRTIWETAYG